MAIYKYTMMKYLKAPSTWVITAISMFIAGFVGGWLPWHLLKNQHGNIIETYAVTVIAITGTITSFLAIFVSVFAGFKAASMFKDEVEDGTFLVMLSKPQTRTKIILQKWFALQTTIVLYALLTVVAFVLSVVINDPGKEVLQGVDSVVKTLTSKIILVGATMLGILIVIGLIFTSVALLLSTRLSVGSTIGISVALGVVIPVTGMVAMFTATKQHESISKPDIPTSQLMFESAASGIFENLRKTLIADPTSMAPADAAKITAAIGQFSKTQLNTLYSNLLGKLRDGKGSLLNIGIDTGRSDSFKTAYLIDLNYQMHTMGSISSDIVVPPAFAALTANTELAKYTGVVLTTKVTDAHPFGTTKRFDALRKEIKEETEALMDIGFSIRNTLYSAGIVDFNFKLLPKWELILKQSPYWKEFKLFEKFSQDMLFKPLGLIISNLLLSNTISEQDYSYADADKDVASLYSDIQTDLEGEYDPALLVDKANPSTLKWMGDKTDDKELIKFLFGIARYDDANNVDHFASIKSVPYAKKTSILWVYLSIALALVPISIYVIRKQDFR